MVVRQSRLTTNSLIAWTAASCSGSQVGKHLSAALVIRRVRTSIWAARLGRNWEIYLTMPRKAQYLTMPRKAHTLVEDFGVGQLRMCSTFEPSASIPAWEILWPRKRIESWNSLVFFLLQ